MEYAISLTYADDTSTSVSGHSIAEVLRKLEMDAKNVLKFMASNGLAANPTETSFIILNDKEEGAKSRKIMVGNVEITQESSAILLGITLDENQNWNTQLYGKVGTLSSLNSRMFIVKRIQNQIGKESITAEVSTKLLGFNLDNNQKWKSQIQDVISNLNSRLYLLRRLARSISSERFRRIADSLYVSKIRYGAQLYGKVRLIDNDPTETLLDSLQITMNKFARYYNRYNLLE